MVGKTLTSNNKVSPTLLSPNDFTLEADRPRPVSSPNTTTTSTSSDPLKQSELSTPSLPMSASLVSLPSIKEDEALKREPSRAEMRWKKAGAKVKMMNMLGKPNADAKTIFRKHRDSVRVHDPNRTISFHNSVYTSSQHVTKLAEIAEKSPKYQRCEVIVVPMTKVHKIWLSINSIFAILTMIATPWLCGFGLSSTNEILNSDDSINVAVMLYALDIFAVVDMLSVCVTGYEDKETTRIILRTFRSTSHYVFSYSFVFDLLSVIPMELLSNSSTLSFRILLLRRMLRIYRASGTWKLLNYLEHGFLNNSKLFPIFKLLATIVYFSHFFACVLQLVRYSEGTYNLPQQLVDFTHPDDSSPYMRSLYETVYLLLGESLDDIYTKNERIFVYLTVLLGAVLNAWLFGQVAIVSTCNIGTNTEVSVSAFNFLFFFAFLVFSFISFFFSSFFFSSFSMLTQ